MLECSRVPTSNKSDDRICTVEIFFWPFSQFSPFERCEALGRWRGRSRMRMMWPDLAKFWHFGKSLQEFGKFFTVYFLFGKILSLLWQLCDIIGLIFIFANGKILNNNLTIWSHWLSLPQCERMWERDKNKERLCQYLQRLEKMWANLSKNWDLDLHQVPSFFNGKLEIFVNSATTGTFLLIFVFSVQIKCC